MSEIFRFFRLQFDAEGDGGADGQGADGGTGTPEGQQQQKDPQQQQTDPKHTPKYSDADVDRLINQKFAAWQKKQEKAVDEAAKLAQMDAQQKAEYERDQLQKELDTLKRANAAAEMAKTARGLLTEAGVTVPDSLVDALVADDAETTKTRVDSFAAAYKAAVQEEVKRLASGTPPKTGKGTQLTRESIEAVKDRAERQKLIRENLDLFKH